MSYISYISLIFKKIVTLGVTSVRGLKVKSYRSENVTWFRFAVVTFSFSFTEEIARTSHTLIPLQMCESVLKQQQQQKLLDESLVLMCKPTLCHRQTIWI